MIDSPDTPLRIIPLGGVGEIGKNMYVFEYGDDIVVIDCGLMFPDEEMFGIDLVVPDVQYLKDNRDKVRAFLMKYQDRVLYAGHHDGVAEGVRSEVVARDRQDLAGKRRHPFHERRAV